MKVQIYANDETGESEYNFVNEMTLKEFDELISTVLEKYPAR